MSVDTEESAMTAGGVSISIVLAPDRAGQVHGGKRSGGPKVPHAHIEYAITVNTDGTRASEVFCLSEAFDAVVDPFTVYTQEPVKVTGLTQETMRQWRGSHDAVTLNDAVRGANMVEEGDGEALCDKGGVIDARRKLIRVPITQWVGVIGIIAIRIEIQFAGLKGIPANVGTDGTIAATYVIVVAKVRAVLPSNRDAVSRVNGPAA